MIRCKFYHLLFDAVPLNAFQSFLIKNHFEKCPTCMEELADPEEVQTLFAYENTEVERINFWPEIQTRICDDTKQKRFSHFLLRWKWALGTASLILLLTVGYWSFNRPGGQDTAFRATTGDQIQINHINIEEKPAGAFIVYQPPDLDTIFIYAERTP